MLNGRASIVEYLITTIVITFALALITLFSSILGSLFLFIGVLIFLPYLSVCVRRLHDQNRSGLLLLVIVIPYLGWFAFIILIFLPGIFGPNRFGVR